MRSPSRPDFLEVDRALVVHVDSFQKSFFVWPATNINSTSLKRLLPGLWRHSVSGNLKRVKTASVFRLVHGETQATSQSRSQGTGNALLGKATTSSTAAREAWKEAEMRMTQYLFHSFPWEGIYYFCYFSLWWFSKCSKLYNERCFMPV